MFTSVNRNANGSVFTVAFTFTTAYYVCFENKICNSKKKIIFVNHVLRRGKIVFLFSVQYQIAKIIIDESYSWSNKTIQFFLLKLLTK